MEIPDIFKQIIQNTFYDKNIEIWTAGDITDNEGAVIENGKLEKVNEFQGNFQFSTREKIQQEYGQEIQANAIVTCPSSVTAVIGNILVYNSKEYNIKSVIASDSHTTILVEGIENE